MSQNRIAIITDSTCDLCEALRDLYDIQMVPLYILWGETQYRDRFDINPNDFYRRLSIDPVRPKTSQPTPEDFLIAYQQAIQRGAGQIVVFPLSEALSGTSLSARQAAGQCDFPVTVADTSAVTLGLGWQVLAASRVRDAGGDVQAIIEAADCVRRKVVLVVMLDTIEFLASGGRIGNAARLINSVLNIKPQVWVNHFTGKIEIGEITRTRARAIEALKAGFFRRLNSTQRLHIAVLHNSALSEGQALLERVRNEYNPVELLLADGSPVIGVHSGPNALALCGYSEE